MKYVATTYNYVFNYRKDSMNGITIAFSYIEKTLRDYYIEGTKNIYKIGDTMLVLKDILAHEYLDKK